MESLHPNTKISGRITGYIFLFFLSVLFFVLFHFDILLVNVDSLVLLAWEIPIVIVLAVLVEVDIRLTYDSWKYELSNGLLHVESGYLVVYSKDVPYKKIQNVEIYRGVFARIFEYSILKIQTAGNVRGFPEIVIPGIPIKRAEEIRAFLMNNN